MKRLLVRSGVGRPTTSVVAVLFFVAPLAAGAQPPGKVHRIGFLGNSTAVLEAHLVSPFGVVSQFDWLSGQAWSGPPSRQPSTTQSQIRGTTPFREGVRELGYLEGQNIVIEHRWAEGRYERFPALTAELLASCPGRPRVP